MIFPHNEIRGKAKREEVESLMKTKPCLIKMTPPHANIQVDQVKERETGSECNQIAELSIQGSQKIKSWRY